MLNAVMISVTTEDDYAELHYAECYADCHYAECRSTQRRGAILTPLLFVACGDDIRSNTDEKNERIQRRAGSGGLVATALVI